MQSVSSRIWTRIAVFISYGDNDYTTGTSKYTTGTSKVYLVPASYLKRRGVSCAYEIETETVEN